MTLSPHLLKLPCMLMLIVLLAACQVTHFESRPSGTYADCDDALVGSWLATQQQADGTIESLGTLDVPAGCSPITMDEDGTPPKRFDYDFSYTRVARMHLLVGTGRDRKTSRATTGSTPAGNGDADETAGFLILRYEADQQHITAYGIDPTLVAHLIVDGKLPGHTQVASHARPGRTPAGATSIDNWIKGDGDAIAAMLQREPTLFSPQPVLMLQRAPAKREDP